MIIKDVSLNYLYVSHPIFVQLYRKVIGLTGTIGFNDDKAIFNNQYKLDCKIIPREKPSQLVILPIIFCGSIQERNKKITEEVVAFNKKDYPVLVIFQNLNEIKDVLEMLIENGVKNINVFDGKDEKIKPNKIAGYNGTVSLGSNICSRGTDIQSTGNPLHVILSY